VYLLFLVKISCDLDRSVQSGLKNLYEDIKLHHLTLMAVNIFYIDVCSLFDHSFADPRKCM